MKNLKKVLSLVLAMAMAASLMTTAFAKGAGDYADADKITNTEAVSVLSALNVINGKGDGTNFDPAGNVTRAEMAKMITIITLNDVSVDAFKGTQTNLKDINMWAEAYIKYCYSQGIIAGRGNGKFAPNDSVTAAEAAKMLLVALGYNARVQSYTGAQWKLNAIRDAQISGMFDKVAVPADKALTRDEAAQMMYNTIKAATITKIPTLNPVTGEQTYTYYANGTPLLEKTFKAVEYIGVMTGAAYADSSKDYTYAGTYKDHNNVAYAAAVKSTTDYSALQGEQVSVIVANAGTRDAAVLGISATGKSVVVNSAVSPLKMDGAKLNVNGTKYELEDSLTVAINNNSYNTIKLVDADANGKLDTQVVTVVKAAKVTYVSEKEIIAGGTTYKFAGNTIASGLAKNDYVTIVQNTDGSYNIEKLAKISGKVDAADGTKVRVDGNWYEKNGNTMNLKDNVEFYAVNGVVVASSAEVITGATINNLVMVLKKTTGLLTDEAIVMDAQGVQKTVKIDGTAPSDGALYTFEETEKGYKFTAAATIGDYTWGTGNYDDADGGKIGSVAIADDAVIFVYGVDHSGTVITGKQLKNLEKNSGGDADGKITETTKGYYKSEKNGLDRVTYAGVQTTTIDKLGVTSGNINYAYVTDNSIAVTDGKDEYREYKVWTGKENLTVREKGTTNRTAGEVLTYDVVTNGVISGVAKLTVNKDAAVSTTFAASVQGIDGDNIYLDGKDSDDAYKLTKDTVYMYIDSNAGEAENIGLADGAGVVLADKYGDGTIFMDNVIVKANGTKEIELVIIDAKNNLAAAVIADAETLTYSTLTNLSVSVATGTKIKAGDAIVITNTDTAAAHNVTVSNAHQADGTTTVSGVSIRAGESITVFMTGAAATVTEA